MESTLRRWMSLTALALAAGVCAAQPQPPAPGGAGINSTGLGGGSGANGTVGAPATNGAVDRNPAHRRARQQAAAEAAASAPRLPEACADGSALLARSPAGELVDCPRPGEGEKPVRPAQPGAAARD